MSSAEAELRQQLHGERLERLMEELLSFKQETRETLQAILGQFTYPPPPTVVKQTITVSHPKDIIEGPPADPLPTFDEWDAELRMRVGRLTWVSRNGTDSEVITEQAELLDLARRRIRQ